jgi:hypothetical protein
MEQEQLAERISMALKGAEPEAGKAGSGAILERQPEAPSIDAPEWMTHFHMAESWEQLADEQEPDPQER